MDNMSLKEIQSKLLLWESSENPLAPLTSSQREAILDLESLILGVSSDVEDVCSYLKITSLDCKCCCVNQRNACAFLG